MLDLTFLSGYINFYSWVSNNSWIPVFKITKFPLLKAYDISCTCATVLEAENLMFRMDSEWKIESTVFLKKVQYREIWGC